jgi:hypothetical protein
MNNEAAFTSRNVLKLILKYNFLHPSPATYTGIQALPRNAEDISEVILLQVV